VGKAGVGRTLHGQALSDFDSDLRAYPFDLIEILAARAIASEVELRPLYGREVTFRNQPAKEETEAIAMSTKRSMLLLMLLMFVGTVAGKSILPKSPKLCIPCTNYCKTHPNSPRCL
jgi:hypothetical protein